MAQKPVIFLAYANDHTEGGRYLHTLAKELDGVRKALYLAEQMDLCEVVERANVTIDQIINVFQDPRYEDRVAIFHYGGHADGYQLLLESAEGNHEVAHGGGLVSFLTSQKGLHLIFLNGCSTEQQSQELVDKGVPLVIGTTASIPDDIATRLAIRFYSSLANGANIARAWKVAEDEINIRGGVAETRDMVMKFGQNGQVQEFQPWRFFETKEAEVFKEWSLPIACGNPLFGLPDLPTDIQPPEEPFLFFKRYERKDAAVFFGRSAYVRDLYDRVTDPGAPPLILFYGQSGVGKSSLLDAGLRPRLEHDHHIVYIRRRPEWGLGGSLERAVNGALEEASTVSESTETQSEISASEDATLSPALKQIIDQLDQSLKDLEGNADPQHRLYLEKLKAMQAQGAGMLHDLQKTSVNTEKASEKRQQKLEKVQDVDSLHAQGLHARWLRAEANLSQPLIVILDQAEEAFTRPNDDRNELDDFLVSLTHIFGNPELSPEGKLILAYRKEYHPEIEKGCKILALPRSQVFLERLKQPGVIEVIRGLTLTERLRNWYHLTVDEDLPTSIASDLLSDRDSPVAPILQILVTKMWNKAKADNPHAPVFSTQLYLDLKEKGILLDEFFEQQVAQLAEAMPGAIESGLLLDVLNYHTTPLGTADSQSLEDIRTYYNHRQDEIDQLVSRCKDLYLLSDYAGKVSLTHDTLAPLVQKAFRESDAPGQRAFRILDNKMLDFDPNNPETTLDPIDLELVEKGENGMRSWQPREMDLVRLSRIRREKEARARKIRWAIFAAGMVMIAALGIFSFFQKRKAVAERKRADIQKDSALYQEAIADSNRRVAEYQEALADSNREVAVYKGFLADSNAKVAVFERDNAVYQARVARAEALVNKTRLQLKEDVPEGLSTAIQAWKTLPSEGTYGAVLEAYHHSPVPKNVAIFGERVTAMASSPGHQFLAVGSRDKEIKVFDPSGNLIHQENKHNAAINDLAFSDTHLASVSEDKALLIRRISNPDAETRTELGDVPAQTVDFFPGGEKLLVGFADRLQVYSIKGKALTPLVTLAVPPTAMTLSPDGSSMLLGYLDGRTELRETKAGAVLDSQRVHSRRINAVGFSESGSKTFSVSNDSTVVIQDKNGSNPRVLKAHDRRVLAAHFFDNDRYIATGSADKTIRIWEVRSGILLLTLRGHVDEVTGLSASADGQTLFSSSSDRTVRAWPLNHRHQQVFTQSSGPVLATAFFGQNDRILVGQEGKEIGWWDGRESYRKAGLDLKGKAAAIDVSPDGKVAVSITSRGEVLRFTDPYKAPVRLLAGDEKIVNGYCVDISKNWIAVGTKGQAFVWKKGGDYQRSFPYEKGWVNVVALSPDEKTLFTATNKNEARIWRIKDGEMLKEFSLEMDINDALFLPVGNTLLLAGGNGGIYRYSLSSGRISLKEMAHTASIQAFDLSPDGNYLATASGTQWYLWNLKTGEKAYSHIGHSNTIYDVSFSPDGKYILTASEDKTARIWLVDVNAILR